MPNNRNLPLYAGASSAVQLTNDGNRGLFFDRFYDAFKPDWTVDKNERGSAQGVWVNKLCGNKSGNAQALKRATRRQSRLVLVLGGSSKVFTTDWRFATGLGLDHPMENGLAWHHTLGVPYLAGSGVKGLCRGWAESWVGEDKSTVDRIFGTQERAGSLIFFDALPVAQVQVSPDVMTPHQGKWYEQGGSNHATEAEVVPADWHDPVPVTFLTVEKSSYLFSMAPRPGAPVDDLRQAFAWLQQALEYAGAGAKTAVGYGHMTLDEAKTEKLQKRREAEKEAEQETALLADMSPLQRKVHEALRTRPNQQEKEYIFLISKLEAGAWDGTDARQVAEMARTLMQEQGKWKEETKAKRPEKDTDYKWTQKALKYLGASDASSGEGET